MMVGQKRRAIYKRMAEQEEERKIGLRRFGH